MVEAILYSTVLLFMSIACSIKLRIARGAILIIILILKGIQQNCGDPIENYVQIINTKNGGNIKFEIKIKPT